MTAIHIIEKKTPDEEAPEFNDPEIQPFFDTLDRNGVLTVKTIEKIVYKNTPDYFWFKAEWEK